MALEYFDPDVESNELVRSLLREGAAVVRNQVAAEVVDAVRQELREPFDKVGRYDESDFNGYKTLRVSRVLEVAPSSVELVGHPRVMEVADAVLLPHCLNCFRSSNARPYPVRCRSEYNSIEAWPGDRTKRSRLGHSGFLGLCLRNRSHKV